MDDDFNTPAAFAVMQGVARELNSAKTQSADTSQLAGTLRSMGAALGILQQDPGVYLQRSAAISTLSDGDIKALIDRRSEARAGKDFKESDRIRNTLAAAGIVIEDKPGGATGWRRS